MIKNLQSKKYCLNIRLEDFESKMENAFNLNEKKNAFISNNLYEGKINDGKLKIHGHSALFRKKNYNFFFFTEVVGVYYLSKGNIILELKAGINFEITIIIFAAFTAGVIQLLFKNIAGATITIIITAIILLFAQKKVESEFEQFTQDFERELYN